MKEIWFDPNMYSWIPGTLLGVVVGIYGAFAGYSIPKKKNLKIIKLLYKVFLVISTILLGVGVIALASKQPYGIWYGFLLPGILGVGVLTLNYGNLYKKI